MYQFNTIEYYIFSRFFEQMSSIKTRKHYVIADAAFSGVWAVFYAISFAYMSYCWSQTSPDYSFAQATVLGAILFAFLSVFTWVRTIEGVGH
jgi:hypothetical protein